MRKKAAGFRPPRRPEMTDVSLHGRNQTLLKQVHDAALKAGVASGIGLWDRFPPGLTMQIVRANIEVQAIDFHPEYRHLIVMDAQGDLYRCESYSSDRKRTRLNSSH